MKTKITICACASRSFINKKQLAELATVLEKRGFEVIIEEDLCRLVEYNSKRLAEITESTIVACHERAVRNLMKYRGYQVDVVYDIRQNSVSAILNEMAVEGETAEADEKFTKMLEGMEPETGEDAWFPVIDTERCVNCRKCQDFCLFGVYTLEGKQVKVLHPENCKNNCPSCARTCPKTAIIFPKYDQSPINGGLEDYGELAIRIDTKALYNQALRERLAHRRASTFIINKEKK